MKGPWVLSAVATLVACAPSGATLSGYRFARSKAIAALGQSALIGGTTITPLAVEEDSRCPSNVQCIQAGTVRVLVRVQEATRSSVTSVSLGRAVPLRSGWLHLTNVCPQKIAAKPLAATKYLFTLVVAATEATLSREGACG